MNWADPLGLFVYGIFNKDTGKLILFDQETNGEMSARFFSGGPLGAAIPAGIYDILSREGRPDFYRLEPVDIPYGDDIDQRTGRGEFRLHKPGGSTGCVTAKTWKDWNRTKSFIEMTKTSSVEVYSKYVNPIKRLLNPKTETLIWYGRIFVTGSEK